MNKSPRTFFRDNALSIVLLIIFLLLVSGQIWSGWLNHNNQLSENYQSPLTLNEYLHSGAFGEAIFENWESEFLQMGIYVIITAVLFQRGSAESNDPDETRDHDIEEKARKRSDIPLWIRNSGVIWFFYKHSLSTAFLLLFAGSFVGHAIFGAQAYNDEAIVHGDKILSTWEYVQNSQFWFESFQNWQSEFLAIFAIVVLSIWLREKHSPESKPLHAKNSDTGA
jgi:hypothetical protein